MRKTIAILGTLLFAMILISGQAMATLYWIVYVDDYSDCTNPDNAVDEADDTYATIGVNSPSQKLGWIRLDFGSYAPMGPDQTFTVYGTRGTGITEEYNVTVINSDKTKFKGLGSGEDTKYEDFTTPSDFGELWRYVRIDALTGNTSGNDTIYGPEIDAVGYYD